MNKKKIIMTEWWTFKSGNAKRRQGNRKRKFLAKGIKIQIAEIAGMQPF